MSPATRRVILANLLVPVVAWIAWDQYEARAFGRAVAAVQARGEPTSVEMLATGGDTPERYQAARMYAAAAQRAAALSTEVRFRLSSLDVDSTAVAVNLDELERTFPHDAPALQLIDQAAPLDFNGFGDLTADLDRGGLGTVGTLCAVRADILSARGRVNDAALALQPCVTLLRTLEPFARGQLAVRVLGSLRILLRHGRPSREALAALQRTFEAAPESDGMVEDTKRRRARFLDDLATPRTGAVDALLSRVMRPWITRTNREVLAAYDEAQSLAAQPWPRKLDTSVELERRFARGLGPRRGAIERQTLPPGSAYSGWGGRLAASALAARRIAIAAVAVERFRADQAGTAPGSLDALIPRYLAVVPQDPFTGRPLVYATTPADYRIYSVDFDRRDDGGMVYGLGAKAQRQPPAGRPRDLGIRVERH